MVAIGIRQRQGFSRRGGMFLRHLGQPKVEDLGVTALRHQNVGWLNVTMNDSFTMSRIQRVGNLNPKRQDVLGVHWPPSDAVLQRHAIEELHDDERSFAVSIDLIDRANVGMVQR